MVDFESMTISMEENPRNCDSSRVFGQITICVLSLFIERSIGKCVRFWKCTP